MHDIDRTLLELGGEGESEYEGDVREYEDHEDEDEDEDEGEDEDEFGDHHEDFEDEAGFGDTLSESEEVALATELVGLSSEEELDFFLGKLIKNASRKLRKYINSPTGRALGGILKGVAKKALPTVANVFAPGLGGPLTAMATDAFGLEGEGLSGEDQEWEAAKSYVRFADRAARNAARAPASAPPAAVARRAVVDAARQHAPGLVRRRRRRGYGRIPLEGQDSGRWIRRGRHIVLLGD